MGSEELRSDSSAHERVTGNGSGAAPKAWKAAGANLQVNRYMNILIACLKNIKDPREFQPHLTLS